MTRLYRSSEQMVKALRDAESQIAAGKTAKEVCRQMGIHITTLYEWRKKFGNMEVSDVKRYKAIDKENQRLKKLVADLSLDNSILKEALSVKY
jgi:putative transposase